MPEKHLRTRQTSERCRGILCLDLGTRTGYVLGSPRGRILTSGSIELANPQELRLQRADRGERSFDLRVLRLWEAISRMHKKCPLQTIVFEDVNFFTSTSQLQVWSSLRGAIWTFRMLYPTTQLIAIPVGTLKKFACGHGHAKKPAMRSAWLLRTPHYSPTTSDDHEIDALWLFEYFLQSSQKSGTRKHDQQK
jgi:hypothetical protein